MWKPVLLYGFVGGVLIAVLKLTEYRWLVVQHSIEIYGGIVATIFAVVGIWLGRKLTRVKETVVVREVPVPAPSELCAMPARLNPSASHRASWRFSSSSPRPEQQGDR
jgi:hypothetical protein